MLLLRFWLSVFFLFFVSFSSSANPFFCACDRLSDSLELVNFYQNLNGDDWIENTNWLVPGMPINTWFGITLNAEGCVEQIKIENNRLSGNLFDFNFPELGILWLSGNQITGNIPDFSKMPNIHWLSLGNNSLSGELPDFSNMPKMVQMSFSQNQLTGNIPDFSNFPDIRSMGLSNNLFEGQIPDFSKIDSVYSIYLDGNNLTGEIPDFTNKPFLNFFLAYDNELEGSIPDFSNSQDLRYLIIMRNKLSGEIPNFSKTPKLSQLYASGNQLEGAIPDFSNTPNLRGIGLSSNKLSGEIPPLTNTSLNELLVNDNQLEGNIPDFSQVGRKIDIKDNLFTFEDLKDSPNLSKPDFEYQSQKLFYTDSLFYAKKSETIETDLGIDAGVSNNIYTWFKDSTTWTAPAGNDPNSNKLLFPSLEADQAARYHVAVTNPDVPGLTLYSRTVSLRVCDQGKDSMELIKLYDETGGDNWIDNTNWKSAAMPIGSWKGVKTDSFGCVRKLEIVDNNLTDTLPILNLNTLDTLILSKNQLAGEIPELEVPFIKMVNLSENDLVGAFPNALSSWYDITGLDLSTNRLSGPINPDLGDLCELELLRLGGNEITGELPEELSMLFNLKIGQVDFSNNLIDSLEDKLIWFCPFGDTILLSNPSYDRFLGICNVQCTGTEWDNLDDFPWIQDTLNNLTCADTACIYNIASAGFVDVRGVTVIFTLSRCYTELGFFPVYTEEVRFFDCAGNRLETASCDQSQFCSEFGAISEDEFAKLNYDIRWDCGTTADGMTSVSEFDSERSEHESSAIIPMSCFPNPADIMLFCEKDERINSGSVIVFDLLGQQHNISVQIKSQYIQLDVGHLKSGLYLVLAKGDKNRYAAKILIE